MRDAQPTAAIMGAGLGKDVALITDGRFSGGTHGFVVGHIVLKPKSVEPLPWFKMVTSSKSMQKRIRLKYICLMLNWQNAKQNGKLLH